MSHLVNLAYSLRGTVPISKWTPLLTLIGAALCLTNWRWVALRTGWRPLPTLAAGLALAGALAMTLSPRGWRGNHHSLAQCLPSGWSDLASTAAQVGSSLESLLNVALLVPLGFALVLASRRVVWPAAFVVLLPVVIELAQIGIRGRQCSTGDWMANSLGGLIGVAAAVAAEQWWRRRARAQEPAQPPALTSS